MGSNKTVIGKQRPVFGIREVAYARESAIKGFIEPIIVAKIRFDSVLRTFVYRFVKNARVSDLIVVGTQATTVPRIDDRQLSPVELTESELLTFCEAITIQVGVIELRLAEAEEEFERVCGSLAEVILPVTKPDISDQKAIFPQIPRYGINELVYLAETAQNVGRLERMRVNSFEFDEVQQQWVYTFVFEQKPGENMTVGDRIDLRSPVVISKFENELLTACEAIPLRVQFLENTLSTNRTKLESVCT